MYSTNGRLHKDTASKKEKHKKQVLVCISCQTVLKSMSKEFGEQTICPNCGSDHLEYKPM
jgi:predicted RNA-binding Zn-ribbon protein involved in translation (DUF1610 family)